MTAPAIRPVRKPDGPEWLRMLSALLPDEADLGAEVAAFLADPPADSAVFVAEREGGGLCGFVEFGTRAYAEGCATSPVGYVEALWVDPDHRRSGVAGLLVEAAARHARSLGLSELASDVYPDNAASLAFHAAAGFEETGRVVCFRRAL